METMINYLNNIFKNMPQTPEVQRRKEEIQSDMESRYRELRQNGKNENEAVGITIGEFGNIEELLDAMGVASAHTNNVVEHKATMSETEARDFIAVMRRNAIWIAFGVCLIMIGISFMIALATLLEWRPIFSETLLPVVLFLFIIPAVALFIYADAKARPYEKYKKEEIYIGEILRNQLEEIYVAIQKQETFAVIIGVSLILCSVVFLLLATAINEGLATIGVSVMLLLIGIALYLFIFFSQQREVYEILLKSREMVQKRRKNHVANAISAFVWPIATCVFLIWGFVFHGFQIAWIIFPIIGILLGGFRGFFQKLKE